VRNATPNVIGSDIWFDSHKVTFQVAGGGTALSASHKWVGGCNSLSSAAASTLLAAPSIASGASSAYREIVTAIGALMNNGTAKFLITTTWTKTGTPGTLITYEAITYRHVAV
jgi:hypothetical protein